MRRAGGFAECREGLLARANVCALRGNYKNRAFCGTEKRGKISCGSKCPPMWSQSTVVNVQNDAFADQIFQSAEFPQVPTERVAETKRNLETDAV